MQLFTYYLSIIDNVYGYGILNTSVQLIKFHADIRRLKQEECIMSERFYMPSMSLMGAGCIEEVPAEIKELGLTKALIVTDKVLNQIGLVGELTKLLEQNGIQYAIYDGVQPNPTVANVNNGLAMLKEENCDFVISFGGGSSHDCCKGIALLATNGGVIGDYEGVNRSKKPQLQ